MEKGEQKKENRKMQNIEFKNTSNYRPSFGLKIDPAIIKRGEEGLKALEKPEVMDKFINSIPSKSIKQPLLNAKDKLTYIKAKYYDTLSFLQEYKNESNAEIILSKHSDEVKIKHKFDTDAPTASLGASKYDSVYNKETNVVHTFLIFTKTGSKIR